MVETWRMMKPAERAHHTAEYHRILALQEQAQQPAIQAPAMPCQPVTKSHRDKLPTHEFPFNACVARTINKK
jgi:hypothetical protein